MSPTESFSEKNGHFTRCSNDLIVDSTMVFRTSRKKTHGDVLLWGDRYRYRPPNRTDLLPSFTCLPTLRWPGKEREQRSEWTKIHGGTRDVSLFLVFTIQWLAYFDHAQNQLQTNYGSPRFPQTYWKLVCREKTEVSCFSCFSIHDMTCLREQTRESVMAIITCIYGYNLCRRGLKPQLWQLKLVMLDLSWPWQVTRRVSRIIPFIDMVGCLPCLSSHPIFGFA